MKGIYTVLDKSNSIIAECILKHPMTTGIPEDDILEDVKRGTYKVIIEHINEDGNIKCHAMIGRPYELESIIETYCFDSSNYLPPLEYLGALDEAYHSPF